MLFVSAKLMAMDPLRQALISAGNKDSALVIYESYSSTQKKTVWVDKMNQVIASNDWSDIQLVALNQLLNKTQSMNFDGTDIEKDSMRIWGASWINNSKSIININQIRQIGAMVMDFNPIPDNAIPLIGAGNGNCECSQDSDFCLAPEDECSTGGCTEKTGCGWWWTYRCNGICKLLKDLGPNTINPYISDANQLY